MSRPVRQRKSTRNDPVFQDSAIAISDGEEDDLLESEETITVAPAKKRKRSPSPSLPLLPAQSHAKLATATNVADAEDAPARLPNATTFNISVKVPAGHRGLIRLQLDPAEVTANKAAPDGSAALDAMARKRYEALSKKGDQKPVGFLDLSAELKNRIYREVFNSPSQGPVGLSGSCRPGRTAALLRTCHEVHEEGRSVLYGSNRFIIARQPRMLGSIWENHWREIGFRAAHTFFKTIGPVNTMLIRDVKFYLVDAAPSLTPELKSNEDRRFVHDDYLISILRHIIDHSVLEKLELEFAGRRRVEKTDDRFLDYMKRVKADKVKFDWDSSQVEAVKTMLLESCKRRRPIFEKKD